MAHWLDERQQEGCGSSEIPRHPPAQRQRRTTTGDRRRFVADKFPQLPPFPDLVSGVTTKPECGEDGGGTVPSCRDDVVLSYVGWYVACF